MLPRAACAVLIGLIGPIALAEPPATRPAAPGGIPERTSAGRMVWEVPIEGTSAVFLAPLPSGYLVATRSGQVSAYRAGEQAPTWRAALPEGLASPPIVSGERIAVAAPDGSIVLLDAADGRVIGEPVPGPPGAQQAPSPTHLSEASGGFLAAGAEASGGSLAFIEASSGAVRWRSTLPAPATAPASSCGELILAGTADGFLTALVAEDGRVAWRKRIGERITTPATCSRNLAWVGSADNTLHALSFSRRRARHRWGYRTGADVAGRIVLHQGRVLFFSFDTYLYALEQDNGHLAWKVRLGRRPQADAALSHDLLLVAPLNADRLEAFRLPDGAQIPLLSLAGGAERFVTPPSLVGGLVVIAVARYGEESSRVIAIDPSAARLTP